MEKGYRKGIEKRYKKSIEKGIEKLLWHRKSETSQEDYERKLSEVKRENKQIWHPKKQGRDFFLPFFLT